MTHTIFANPSTAQRARSGALRRRTALGVLAAIGLAPGLSTAQTDYPNRLVRFVVPFGPGSGAELAARFIGKKFTEITGQPVTVEPRGGANGFIAVQAVLSAPHDGYTLLFGSNSTLATNAALFKALPYDPLTDFAPVSLVMRSPIVFLTASGSPYKTLGDFVAAAKAVPKKQSIASGSAGYQLMAALFGQRAGFEYSDIPYKSAPEAVLAAVSGQVDISVVDITSAMPLIRGGRGRALAIASERRNPGIPDVPTAAEAGVINYTAAPWNGLVAPSQVPPAIVEKLSSIFVRIMAMPETQAYFDDQFVEVMKGGAAEMRAYQREEVFKWKKIATEARIELQ